MVLLFLDFTLAIIFERSVFEKVSTIASLDDFYPRLIKFDCLEDFVPVYLRRFFNSYCKSVFRNIFYDSELRTMRLPCEDVLIAVFAESL